MTRKELTLIESGSAHMGWGRCLTCGRVNEMLILHGAPSGYAKCPCSRTCSGRCNHNYGGVCRCRMPKVPHAIALDAAGGA